MAKVVTITVGTNEKRWLTECFRTLCAPHAADIEVECVLVDNASSDGTRELMAEQFPDVKVLTQSSNLGFAGANNVGLRAADRDGADYAFLVNPDTRTPPGLLERLVEFMEKWPQYGLIGPMQYAYPDSGDPVLCTELNRWSREALAAGEAHVFVHTWPNHASEAGPAAGRAPATLEHAYVQGSALFCRMDVLRRIGFFDPAYHTFYEETDLCRRVRWAGWRVALLTDEGIQHHGGSEGPASKYRRRHMLRNKYYFLFTDPGWRAADTVRLTAKWIVDDFRRRGPAPAATTRDAVGDTLSGLGWLVRQSARIARIRRSHARLRSRGAGGPLRETQ